MIPILMYHQVAEIPRNLDPLGLAVPPAQFEQQMSYLARNGYRCLTLPEAVRYLRKGGRAPARSFVLTFDDGYQDVHSRACPILEKFGFTATVFLVAGRMGAPSNWGARRERARGCYCRGLRRETWRGGDLSWEVTRSATRGSACWMISPPLRKSGAPEMLLQDRLDMQVDFFSYPYSDTDARIEWLVESAGYTAACAGDSGPWSVFHLWRVPCLRDDTTLSFALKASGWYHRRIALRESAPGRLLRRGVRMFRSRLGIRHPSRYPVLNPDLDRESEKEP